MKKFGDIFEKISKPIFKKHGFSNQKIISQWKYIVGEKLSQICVPEKITFPPESTRAGILHLAVFNPAFSLEIQAQETRIIEKIATFFGYRAVARIKIAIRPINHKYKEPKMGKPKVISEASQKKVSEVKDKELADALASLYEEIK